jgi:hypothetical protein
VSGWQDIATAPRDGTDVLVWAQFAGEISGPHDNFEMGIAAYNFGTTDFAGYEWNALGGDAYAVWCRPTHWMPLPDAPRSDADQHEGKAS